MVLDWSVLPIFLHLRRYSLRPARLLGVDVIAGTVLNTGQVGRSSGLHVGWLVPHPVPLEAALLLFRTHMT